MHRCNLDVCFDILSSKHAPKRLNPRTGVLPSESGVSWFGVLVIANFPPSTTSQAQPEPKRVVAAFVNSSLNSS